MYGWDTVPLFCCVKRERERDADHHAERREPRALREDDAVRWEPRASARGSWTFSPAEKADNLKTYLIFIFCFDSFPEC
jgi:hypothetical protein